MVGIMLVVLEHLFVRLSTYIFIIFKNIIVLHLLHIKYLLYYIQIIKYNIINIILNVGLVRYLKRMPKNTENHIKDHCIRQHSLRTGTVRESKGRGTCVYEAATKQRLVKTEDFIRAAVTTMLPQHVRESHI
jgi:hypothetical protein